MRKVILAMLLMSCSAFAQFGSSTAKRIISGNPKPATCAVGDKWMDNSTNPAVEYTCTAPNTWTANGSSPPAAAYRTKTCQIVIGADNGSALADADISPQKAQCLVDVASTILQVQVTADGGTPSFNVSRNRAGAQVGILTGSLSTAAVGGIACSNTSGTLGIDGVTTCTNTLTTTALNAGDYIDITSGTAGGVAKRITISITYRAT